MCQHWRIYRFKSQMAKAVVPSITVNFYPMVGRGHCGLSVYFASLTHFIEDLRKAYEGNPFDKRLEAMRPGILVIDEVGYPLLDSLASNMCFQIVSVPYNDKNILHTLRNKLF
jgi:DNA replication protein DnaC